MGLFSKLKKRRVEEGAEETKTDTPISPELEPALGKHLTEEDVVCDICDQLADITRQIKEISAEYTVVTKYLSDIQRIEELPVEMAQELVDLAGKIETLDKNRKQYIDSEKLLSPEQYNVMATHEEDMPGTIRNLYEMEQHHGALANDMGYLEGEKEDLKYMREEYSEGISRVRSVVVTVLVMFLITNMIFFIYAYTTKNNVVVYSLFTGAIAVLVFTIAYVRYGNLKRSFKENEAKIKRAVSLQNKVKAKYINNVNTVDYIYEKYGVNSCKELEYVWEQYNIMVKDAEKYNKANKNLKRLCDELTIRLSKLSLNDPDVWIKQASALVDRREMVEIKHGLIARRQKLRENLITSQRINENAFTALNAAQEANPALGEVINKQLAKRGLAGNKLED